MERVFFGEDSMRNWLWFVASLALLAGCGKSGDTTVASGGGGPTAANTSTSDLAAANATDGQSDNANSAGAAAPDAAPDAAPSAPATDTPAADGMPPTGAAADVLKQALAHYEAGELTEAVAAVQRGLQANPDSRELSIMLAKVQQGAAIQTLQTSGEKAAGPLFLAGAALARQLQQKYQPLDADEGALVAQSFYNGACFMAKDNKLAEAQAYLAEAVDAGFDDLNLLDSDADLNPLREQPAFKTWRESINATIAASKAKKLEQKLAAFEPFPFDFELPDVDDKPRKLADYRGKVLIVDIWGTWCPPCRMEIPHFIELQKKYSKQGFDVVGINYEDGSPEDVKKLIKDFMKENGMTYTCVVGDDATRDRVPNFEGFPTTLFIDRSGKVRLKEVGYKPLAELEAIVTALIAEKAPEAAADGAQ
jgi:thiol-disulfide isomerase/thioredoxin